MKKNAKVTLSLIGSLRKNIFFVGFLLFVLATIFSSSITRQFAEDRILYASKNLVKERSIGLDAEIKRNVDFVLGMKSIADIYIDKRLSEEMYERYLIDVKRVAVDNNDGNYHVLPAGAEIGSFIVKSTIFSKGLSKDINNEYLEILNMTLELQEFQKASIDYNDSIILSYYIKRVDIFDQIYPIIPIVDILDGYESIDHFAESAYSVYNDFASPEVNPEGDYFWTEPYYDRVGNGMMVSCAIPTYDENIYNGVLGCDMVIRYIDGYTSVNESLPGKFYLVSDSGYIISSSEIFYEDEKDIVTFEDFVTSSGKSDDLVVFSKELVNAPWQLKYIINSDDLNKAITNVTKLYIFITSLVLITSVVAYVFIRKYFIIPGINAETELLELNEVLDIRVNERTVALLETSNHLEKANARLMNLLKASTEVAVIVTDYFGSITLFNIGAEKMLGYRASEVIDRESLIKFYNPSEVAKRADAVNVDTKAKSIELMKLLINEDRLCSEWIFVKSNGQEINVLLSGNIISDSEGNPSEIICIAIDITKRMQMEEELKLMNVELEQRVYKRTTELEEIKAELEVKLEELTKAQEMIIESEKLAALGTLVTGMAHEINTPLGVGISVNSLIINNRDKYFEKFKSGILTKSGLEDFFISIEETTRLVQRNLERIDELVHRFKQLSATSNYYILSRFNFTDYLKDISALLMTTNLGKAFRIYSESTIAEIESYEGAFTQILTHLVTNSVKHGFTDVEDGVININAVEYENHYELEYTDNGDGISEEDKKRIFEPFYTTNRKEGTGLGMMVIHNIVRQKLNGNILIDDNEPNGVRFVISWNK